MLETNQNKVMDNCKRTRVACYCSSRGDLPAEVVEGTGRIVSAIGEAGAELIYGGVNAGLMHVVAAAAHESGAKVIGVVPEVFRHRADKLCDEVILTKDLSERKGVMIDTADIFIVLPGGIGTIDEWISTLSHIMVQEKVDPDADKPILVWSYNDMYRGMAEQLHDTDQSIYARGKRVDRSMVFTDPGELISRLSVLLHAGREDS